MTDSCKDCGTALEPRPSNAEKNPPCPQCGSAKRVILIECESQATVGVMLATKGYEGGKSRKKGLKFESKGGDSFSTSLGRFVKIEQLVDHENKRYIKRVVDPKTGEVLRDVDEPLPDHTDRGSAKKPSP